MSKELRIIHLEDIYRHMLAGLSRRCVVEKIGENRYCVIIIDDLYNKIITACYLAPADDEFKPPFRWLLNPKKV